MLDDSIKKLGKVVSKADGKVIKKAISDADVQKLKKVDNTKVETPQVDKTSQIETQMKPLQKTEPLQKTGQLKLQPEQVETQSKQTGNIYDEIYKPDKDTGISKIPDFLFSSSDAPTAKVDTSYTPETDNQVKLTRQQSVYQLSHQSNENPEVVPKNDEASMYTTDAVPDEETPEKANVPDDKKEVSDTPELDFALNNAGQVRTLTANKDNVHQNNKESRKNKGRQFNIIKKSNKIFNFFTTGANPATWLSNLLRDPLSALITTGSNPMLDYQKMVGKNFNRNIDKIKDTVKNTSGPINKTKAALDLINPLEFVRSDPELHELFKKSFGNTFMLDKMPPEEQDAIINQTLLDFINEFKTAGGTPNSALFEDGTEDAKTIVGKIAHRVYKFPQIIPNSIDRNVRSSVYAVQLKKALEQGYDYDYAHKRALFMSRNATADFEAKMGSLEKLRGYAPYLVSAVNGTRSFYRMMSIDPTGMMIRITSGVMMPIMALTVGNTDPQNADVYERIPEYIKENNAVAVVNGTVYLMPLPQELRAYNNFARRMTEFVCDYGNNSVFRTALKSALDIPPIDIEWVADAFNTKDKYGQPQSILGNFARGLTKSATSLSPALVQTAYGLATGRDMYFGSSINNYSDKGGVYDKLAELAGLDMSNDDAAAKSRGQVQTVLEGLFGSTTAGYLINLIDTAMGVPEKERGGKSLLDSVTKVVTGKETTFNAARNEFYSLIDTLTKEKDKLKLQLKGIDKQIREDGDSDSLENKKQKLVDEYSKHVSEGVEKWQELFQYTGGINRTRKNQLLNLLNIGSDNISEFDNTQWQSEVAQDMNNAEYNEAVSRYNALGFDDPTPQLLPMYDKDGNVTQTANPIRVQDAINKRYGVPKQAAFDLKNIYETETNGISLKDIRQNYYNKIQAIYDDADRSGTKPNYTAIANLQYQYLRVFDTYMGDFIKKYGVYTLQSSKVVDQLEDMLNGMIPSDETAPINKKTGKVMHVSTPMKKDDVKDWIAKHYGFGKYGDGSGEPSDEEVTKAIDTINSSLKNGKVAQAKAVGRRINNRIANNEVYASGADMDVLSNLLY